MSKRGKELRGESGRERSLGVSVRERSLIESGRQTSVGGSEKDRSLDESGRMRSLGESGWVREKLR